MRTNRHFVHIRALALLALALIVSSCSRMLPTAPEATVTRGGDGADPFATVGLENQVAITLAPGVDPADLAVQYGAKIMNSEAVEGTAALRPINGQTPAALMNQLIADGRVLTAEPNGWLSPAEARQQSFAFDDGNGTPQTFAEQPAGQAIRLTAAHAIATGKGVKVAIIDTGCDLNHPLLRRAIVGGWDFVDNDPIPAEKTGYDSDGDHIFDEAYGHGTHVAGIVHLVAPDAQLLIVRVLDGDGRGDLVNVAAGIRWAIRNGAKVINVSLGSLKGADALQDGALVEAEEAGVMVFAAAGNWGTDANVDFPGRSSHAACVAAVTVDAAPAPFSSYGSDVRVSAPGIGIRSTYPGGGYRLWSGTSMSTPFVAGTAALIAEKHPLWTRFEAVTRLEATASPFDKSKFPAGNANKFGSGMLDAYAAMLPDFVAGPNQDPAPEEIRPR